MLHINRQKTSEGINTNDIDIRKKDHTEVSIVFR